MNNKFYRSYRDRKISGVCSGLARHTNTDVTLWRLLFVVSFFTALPSLLTYIAITLLTETIEYND